MALSSGDFTGGNTIGRPGFGGGIPRARVHRRRERPAMRVMAALPHAAFGLAVVCVVLAVLSGLGHRWDWWHYRTAFTILRWSAYGGLLATALGLIGGFVTRPGAGRSGFGYAVLGVVAGMLVFWTPYLQLRVVYSLPFIHDITTDTENPPPFVELLQARMASPNGADYEGQELADQQRAAYPDIGPLYFDRPVESVFAQAERVARGMGWKIAATHPGEGRIEGTATTFWYGFKDDIVIRIAAEPVLDDEGEEVLEADRTRVDLRSMSRVGRSDVGVNARRIRTFVGRLEAGLR